jgi:large subunit ribosomal protein L31
VVLVALLGQGNAEMKKDIHPNYQDTNVHCGCGNEFVTRSTAKELRVDICNMCHPFFTGKLKFVDAAGRIEKFKNKFAGNYASLQKGKKKTAEAGS